MYKDEHNIVGIIFVSIIIGLTAYFCGGYDAHKRICAESVKYRSKKSGEFVFLPSCEAVYEKYLPEYKTGSKE